ncbi:hypothetical protein JCM10450v2_004744 [Rhodotorula kratochvilovae]
MAKKGRNAAAEPTAATPVTSRDSLKRLSFLYQASTLLNDALQLRPAKRRRATRSSGAAALAGQTSGGGQAGAPATDPSGEDKGKGTSADQSVGASRSDDVEAPTKRRRKAEGSLKPLARHLAREMTEVAKKATVRMDPSIKRTLCTACGAVLIPGVSSSVRVKPSGPHGHVVVHHCLSCRSQRRFPAPPHLGPPAPPDDLEAAAEPVNPVIPQTKRERREARQAQVPVFFEREGHVVVRGSAVDSRDEYREA